MKSLSVEYAHIYTNGRVGENQELSLKILGDVHEENMTLAVLVDDYSFPDPTFDYDAFVDWLATEGYRPDVLMRESQLIPLCDQVLSLLADSDLKQELVEYIRSKKYPCSLFIAAWYLLRLGMLSHPAFGAEFYAERLINILPESFRSFEEKGFAIIRATPHARVADAIENRYFEGRSIQ